MLKLNLRGRNIDGGLRNGRSISGGRDGEFAKGLSSVEEIEGDRSIGSISKRRWMEREVDGG